MASNNRLIDKLPAVPREKEMKVVALGLARTGTDSLKTALNQLGYNSYHMYEVMRLDHGPHWVEAINSNLDPRADRPRYGRAEFDKLLHDFDATTDMPVALFVDDLLAAYPDAKIVLTIRDFESWWKSLNGTIFPVITSPAWACLNYFDRTGFGRALKAGHRSFAALTTDGDIMDKEQLRKGFEAHYARVRALVPKERLLEFKSQEGWEPLCKFLGKDMPNAPYPRTNDAIAFNQTMNHIFYSQLAGAVTRTIVWTAGIAIPGFLLWKFQQTGRWW